MQNDGEGKMTTLANLLGFESAYFSHASTIRTLFDRADRHNLSKAMLSGYLTTLTLNMDAAWFLSV